ncbi:MAG: DUF2442 domain-containing protein [Hyphomicrobiaceae bacterium]
MGISVVELSALAQSARCTDDELIVTLVDGRTIAAPIIWFPTLAKATPAQRTRVELLGQGEGLHWPDLDEDISVAGLLRGTRPTA